ncbi:GMP synthase [Rhodococcus sp. WMMA185]|uniref:type 1 glutamine amidotransferase n=1 Tax=Rhodococcus sp. WMMA185 TaxID=679318 RepID=UPI00087AFF5B|nr:type 1 glutamine amidotransferase [Rhodococcus sp. WMMA185]AOW91753.1 GMP synthase [Rhodococcus sp. WMMA185]
MNGVVNKPWAVVKHVPVAGPALVGALLDERGIPYIEYPLYESPDLPSITDIGGLAVMGGPLHDREDFPYAHLPRERNLIKETVDAGLPMIGICLGAQLLATAFGSELFRGRLETGAGRVTVTEDGARDPVVGSVGSDLPAIHWHQDSFDLPVGAVRLASSKMYENQAFTIGRLAYGFQFHAELTRAQLPMLQAEMPEGAVPSGEHLDEVEAVGRKMVGSFLDLAEG